jgi:hypothetical protein
VTATSSTDDGDRGHAVFASLVSVLLRVTPIPVRTLEPHAHPSKWSRRNGHK